MKEVRIGIIGIGGMGANHAGNLAAGNVPRARLAAVCDVRPERLAWASEHLGSDVARFADADSFFADAEVDGVVIATPHYDHPSLAIRGFDVGMHVMTEKPAGVYTKQVREMNERAASSGKVFGIMYNQRTAPVYGKLRDLIVSGEIGELKRTNWIITSWYRSQSYYDSGGWRATWSGEGGGVLLNQDPHQLDLWQWCCGMPSRLRAFCYFGKYHDIEVEDDVTAFVEYPNGATGVFVTSTGDAPGTNRLEISGERGKVVVEDGRLTFWRLRTPERQFNREYTGGFGQPECWKCDVPVDGEAGDHVGILTNWVNAILDGEPLLAPGEEGIKGLSISNAMHLSTWTDEWVRFPIDEDRYLEELNKRIAKSTSKKEVDSTRTMNVDGTFA